MSAAAQSGECGRGGFGPGPKPGELAPDFELKATDGQTNRASSWWKLKPTVIMTGSYTCPVFRGEVEPFEQLARDFKDRVNFIVLYTQEAHPKGDPSPYRGVEWVTPANEREGILIPQPKTPGERTTRAGECVAAMKLTVPVVVDQLDNATWKAYGRAPNSACLIAKGGKVFTWQSWFDPAGMRQALERLFDREPATDRATTNSLKSASAPRV